MKTSTIISQLQELVEEHGDLRIIINSDGYSSTSPDYASIVYRDDDGEYWDTHYISKGPEGYPDEFQKVIEDKRTQKYILISG